MLCTFSIPNASCDACVSRNAAIHRASWIEAFLARTPLESSLALDRSGGDPSSARHVHQPQSRPNLLGSPPCLESPYRRGPTATGSCFFSRLSFPASLVVPPTIELTSNLRYGWCSGPSHRPRHTNVVFRAQSEIGSPWHVQPRLPAASVRTGAFLQDIPWHGEADVDLLVVDGRKGKG